MDEKLKQEIDQLKLKGHSVYKVSLAGESYVYRSVNRKEFRSLQDKIAATAETLKAGKPEDNINTIKEESEMQLVKLAVVSPSLQSVDLDSVQAGVVTRLSELILEASAFGEEVSPVKL